MKITATIFLALLALAAPAQALVVSKDVGPLLREAQQMIAAKNFEGATATLDEADAVKSNPDDETVIAQFRHVIAVCSSDANCPRSASQP